MTNEVYNCCFLICTVIFISRGIDIDFFMRQAVYLAFDVNRTRSIFLQQLNISKLLYTWSPLQLHKIFSGFISICIIHFFFVSSLALQNAPFFYMTFASQQYSPMHLCSFIYLIITVHIHHLNCFKLRQVHTVHVNVW